MLNHYSPLTQLKYDVQTRKNQKYQQIKQKSTYKYYQLYLNKIIFLQRSWRNHLVKKNIQLQTLTNHQLQKFTSLKQTNIQLKSKLHLIKNSIKQQQNLDPNQKIQIYKNELQNQLHNSLSSLFDRADRYAKIKAVLQTEMTGLKDIEKENIKLKKQCQKGRLQKQIVSRKNQQLKIKINHMKKLIMVERNNINRLKKQNIKIDANFQSV